MLHGPLRTIASHLTALSALGLSVACDPEDVPESCFPVPAEEVLRAAHPGSDRELQGSSMQGSGMQGTTYQGTTYQGTTYQGTSYQGTYLGLGDLNGARFELSGSSTVMTVRDGRLVALGDRGADAPLPANLLVQTRDGREIAMRVTTVETIGDGERFAMLVGRVPVCEPGDEGVFVAGHWDETGAHSIDGDELTYSCMSGVIAKCVAWGYAPWLVGADVHQACTRLARADYCGDGNPWTLDGTMIDVYDDLGVQTPVDDPQFSFEAAWGSDGAVCVNETRYVVEDGDGRAVRPACFADLPTCTSLQQATALGAVLANDSAHATIDACE